MDAVEPITGKPIYKAIPKGEVWVVQQEKRTRRWPGIWQQWVICALIELNADDGAIHGTGIAAWIPCYDRRSRPVCLPEGIRPNQETTESFIKQIRKMRTRDAEELGKFEDYHKPATVPMDESERNTRLISQADKKKFDSMKYAIKSGFTAFGEEPGKRGSTSFPKTAKEMAAEFSEYRRDLDLARWEPTPSQCLPLPSDQPTTDQ